MREGQRGEREADATWESGARRRQSGPPRQGRIGHDGSTYRVPHDLLAVRSAPPPGVSRTRQCAAVKTIADKQSRTRLILNFIFIYFIHCVSLQVNAPRFQHDKAFTEKR